MVSYMWWIVTLSLRCTVFWDIELEIRVMGHSRSSVPTSIDLPHYDFLLMFRSNHRTISFRDRRQFQSENRQFSPPPVYLGSSLTGFPLEFGIGARARGQKTRMMGLPDGRKSFKIFSRSDTIPAWGRHPDTWRQQRPRLRIASRGKNLLRNLCA